MRTIGSSKFVTILTVAAVIASALAVLFVLHAESDDSSAGVTESGCCGDDAYYFIYSDGTLEIRGSGAIYDYGGFFERSPWYDHRDEITKIVIGDDITHLGQWAFVKCKHVKELTMPITLNSVTSDTACAFAGCYNIEKVNFTLGKDGYGFDYAAHEGSNSWYQLTPWYQSRDVLEDINFTDGIRHIGSDAFRELNITALVIPESVTSLGCHTFFNCTKLADLTIPISLNSYYSADYPAFIGCLAVEKVTFTRGNGVPFDYSNWAGMCHLYLAPWNLNDDIAKTIVISDNITKLGRYMFYHTNIKELTLPVDAAQYFTGISYIYSFLAPYDSLEKVTLTPGSGKGLDFIFNAQSYLHNPWNQAPNLKSVIVEEGVHYLGESTFDHCTAESIVLPNYLLSLGESAFTDCNVKCLTIPIGVNAAGKDPVFSNMSGLEKVIFEPGWGYGVAYQADKGGDAYFRYTPWYQCRSTVKEIVLEDGIKGFGADAFRQLNITSIVIPDTVESLGEHTFYHCDELTDVTIPITVDSNYSSKYSAFDQCNNIGTLRFTAGKDGIGFDYNDIAPHWCTPSHHVSRIIIDSGVKYIGIQIFAGYSFFGSNGLPLQQTAEDLSGHIFENRDGAMHQIDVDSEDLGLVDFSDSSAGQTVSTVTGQVRSKDLAKWSWEY